MQYTSNTMDVRNALSPSTCCSLAMSLKSQITHFHSSLEGVISDDLE